MSDVVRAVPSGYGPRYGPFSTYAPQTSWSWCDPADDGDAFPLWTPPGHAFPVLPSTHLTTETSDEEKSA